MDGESKKETISIGEMTIHLSYLRNDMADVKKHLVDIKDHYVTKEEFNAVKKTVDENLVTKADFEPVKKVVYGLVAIILTSVAVGLLALVLK